MSRRPAVFLDRDGTLIDELGYLADPDGVKLYPGAARAAKRLSDAGFLVILITNQSGVARGFFSEDDLAHVHQRLAEDLARDGARLDGIYYCPHHPEAGEAPYRRACDCRKPLPGMVTNAAAEHGIDLSRSWMVGDAARDLLAGKAAGLSGLVLVRTGKGAATETELPGAGLQDALVLDDISAAAEHILHHGK